MISGCGDSTSGALSQTESGQTQSAAPVDQTEAPAPGDLLQTASVESSAPKAPVDQAKIDEARALFAIVTDPSITPEQWETAQQQLMEMGGDAVPVLAEKLRSTDRAAREIASSMFAFTGPAAGAAVDALTLALEDDSDFVRANCAVTLAQIPEHSERAIPVFVELLSSDDSDLRRMAASNLAQYGQQASLEIPKLTAALDQEDAAIVRPVVELLGRIGPPARPALSKLQQIAFESTGDDELQSAAKLAVEQIEATAP